MDLREIIGRLSNTFFVTFFWIMLAMTMFLRYFGASSVSMNDIYTVIALSALTTIAELVLYSKRELTKLDLLVRHLIHLAIAIMIVLAVANFRGWMSIREPMHVLIFTGIILVVHVVVTLIQFYQTARSADLIAKKLRERYK